ncbi:MAG: two-component system, OmpR family, sensor histidine kinase SenX3, partial [Actinomycetota bacterium]|nr:two-component system, OmpR family, sensor histidine kinase SenX3 [Actinomycetota bacterium]
PRFVDEIVDRMGEGVVVLSDSLTPLMANPAARSMLGLPPDSLPARLRSDEMLSLARRAVADQQSAEAEISLWPRRITVRVRALPMKEAGAVVVYFQDVTQEAQVQQIRRQFVVNASHELKTPVTGLMALGEAVRNALPSDVPAAERFSEQLIREAERLTNLTRDLLDLTRVEDPSYLKTESVDLTEVARNELGTLDTLAERRGVKLVTYLDESVRVRGDRQQLGLMVKNLVDNAIRYSDEGGTVSIEVQCEEEEAIVRVADTGSGIPLRDQGRVFERFYRVDEGRARESGGSGLGLSIVKHVTELHSGHVGLISELGEGSTFTVHLPLLRESA